MHICLLEKLVVQLKQGPLAEEMLYSVLGRLFLDLVSNFVEIAPLLHGNKARC